MNYTTEKKYSGGTNNDGMQMTADRAFERFKVWCKEREIPEETIGKYMYMWNDGKYYQFKNINTRNYIFVNIQPVAFNL